MSWWDPDREDTTIYKVVVNHEEQYSIWPADKKNPRGWKDVDKSGTKAECLAHIKEIWTDMRPLSLRKSMEEAAYSKLQPQPSEPTRVERPMDDDKIDLVKRLSEGTHPVELTLRPDLSVSAFGECIGRGFIHLKFTDTRGGTEIGIRLDREATRLEEANFENRTGHAHLVGGLTLNYVKVRCIADIDLATLKGNGHLEPAV